MLGKEGRQRNASQKKHLNNNLRNIEFIQSKIIHTIQVKKASARSNVRQMKRKFENKKSA